MDEEILEELEELEEDTQKGRYLTFCLAEENYGLELQCVEEIISMQKITEVPETETYIKGLINLRGKIIPVIDVRVRLNQEPFEYTERTCIIIIRVKDTVVGLIVEKIAEVISIGDELILPPPSLNQGNMKHKYVYGIAKVGDSVKLLLDANKLIHEEDMFLLDGREQSEDAVL